VNTLRQLEFFRLNDAKLIHEMFTGPNLRWEIIGIIFTLVASQGLSDQATDPVGQSSQSRQRKVFSHEMAKASDLCLSFCNNNEHLNDLVAWYQYESMLLQTKLLDDTSKTI
jgi:hypothetical protein